jgi:Tol biopolymer transport system component
MNSVRVGVAVALAGAALALVGGASARSPRALVVYSQRGHIESIAADGTEQTILTGRSTHRYANSFSPAWAPNGGRIVFVKEGSALNSVRDQIEVMRPDGSDRHAFPPTKDDRHAIDPVFSPDGTALAYTRVVPRRDGLVTELAVAHTGEPGFDVLVRKRFRDTDSEKKFRFIYDPAWAPDGTSIFFTEGRYAQVQRQTFFLRSLHKVALAGGPDELVAHHASTPTFSPDGNRMVYSSEQDRNGSSCYEECTINGELYVSRIDGTHAHRLTHTEFDETQPDWSADGHEIVYERGRVSGAGRLFLIPPSGACAPVVIAPQKSGLGTEPDWQPNPSLSSDPGTCLAP